MRTLLLFAAALATVPFALVSAQSSASIERAVAYIRTTQQPDGGFGGFGAGQTFDAILAIRAAGIDPNTVTTAGKSPADFLRANAAAQSSPAAAAKAALAARALGIPPRDVAGTDLVAAIAAGYNAGTGQYGADPFSQSLAMLGLACTGNSVPSGAVLALRNARTPEGGWGFEGANDPDTTALAVQALIAAGVPVTDAAVVDALGLLADLQGLDGGWGFDPSASNANSTAFVIQALIAAGRNPALFVKNGNTPGGFLASQQQEDGSFAGFDPAFATNQVVPALAGRTFCNAADTSILAQPQPTTPAPTTPSVTPPPITTTAPPVTTAPLPPRTGSGMGGEGLRLAALIVAGALLAAGGGAGLVARRRE